MKRLRVLLLVLPLLLHGACSSTKIDENNPDDLMKEAEADIKDKRYIQAGERLRIIKNKFPYSHVSTAAALRLADVAFLEESYGEAAASYESFRDLHPKHEKADYVIFRIGESYFKQMPDHEARDLTPGVKSIEAYEELGKLYPSSIHLPEAKAHLAEAKGRLASKERYIGDFYFKRDMYDSAAMRYEKLATQYAGTSFEEDAYMDWAESLHRQNKDDEARHVLQTYLSRFPEGRHTGRAKRGY